jgi:hypothetical protein
MYPALPNCRQELSGTAILPDGRKVTVYQEGYVEGDTNAFVETGDGVFKWEDGEELTDEEINLELEREGRKFFLHEYVWEFIKWDE